MRDWELEAERRAKRRRRLAGAAITIACFVGLYGPVKAWEAVVDQAESMYHDSKYGESDPGDGCLRC